MLPEPAEPAPVELPYTVRLQSEAAGRKFIVFAEALALHQSKDIRSELQAVLDEKIAAIHSLNLSYWQDMAIAENKLRKIRELLDDSDLAAQVRAVIDVPEIVVDPVK